MKYIHPDGSYAEILGFLSPTNFGTDINKEDLRFVVGGELDGNYVTKQTLIEKGFLGNGGILSQVGFSLAEVSQAIMGIGRMEPGFDENGNLEEISIMNKE